MIDHSKRQRNLRKGRVSLPGYWYMVTLCTDKKKPLLISGQSKRPEQNMAEIIVDSLKYMHEQGLIECKGYVVMPDHVHSIFALGVAKSLSEVMQSWKRYSANQINKILGLTGHIWQEGYYDTCLRSEHEFIEKLRYMYENPVRKEFVSNPNDWPYSSINIAW
jgi:REP element-mobilizing transposase RayT